MLLIFLSFCFLVIYLLSLPPLSVSLETECWVLLIRALTHDVTTNGRCQQEHVRKNLNSTLINISCYKREEQGVEEGRNQIEQRLCMYAHSSLLLCLCVLSGGLKCHISKCNYMSVSLCCKIRYFRMCGWQINSQLKCISSEFLMSVSHTCAVPHLSSILCSLLNECFYGSLLNSVNFSLFDCLFPFCFNVKSSK